MARVNCNYSISASGGESVTRDGYPALRAPYYSSSSDSSRSTMDLKITSVQYETTTQTYYVGWECKMYSPGSNGRYSCAAVGAAMGGSYTGSQSGWGTVNLGPYVIMSKTPSSGSYIWGYADWSSSTVPDYGTYETKSTSVYLDVRHMMSGGYASDTNHTRWWEGANGYRKIGYGYLNITAPSVGNPSIDVTHGSTTAASRGGSNGKATVSATASAGTNGGNVSYTISFNGSSKTDGSISATNLKNNTTYSYSGTATNSAGKTASDSGNFYLTPVAPAAPTIGTPTCTRSGNTYNATATVSSSYDTLRAWSSWTSTGLSMSGSNSSSVSYSNLTPNTSYTFTLKTNDKNNGGAHSAGLSSGTTSKTFTTPGNAPTITSHGLSVGGQTSVTMAYSATYDTNSSLSSMRWDYTTGTLPSGATNPTASNTNTISGLQPNTTYNYRLVVVENVAGRTTTATGTFTTDYPTQQITNMSVQGVGEEFVIVNVNVPNVSWLSKVTCWVYEADGTTLKATQTLTSSIAATNTFTFEALDPGTVYIVKAQITTKGRNTTYNSNIVSVEAETLDASPANIIRSNGTVEKHKIYVMGSGNIFNPMKMSWQNGYYTTGAIGNNISSLLNINEGACSTKGIAVIPNISYTIKNNEEGMTYIVHGTDENGVVTEVGYAITYGNNYTFTTATNTTRLWISATSTVEPINYQTVQYYKLNIFRTIEKTVIPKENIVYINGKIRYIDILSAGSTANISTHIVELKVFNTAGENIALGKPVEIIKGTPEANAYGNTARVTDGDTATGNYLGIGPKTPLNLETCVRVDLGQEYTDISHVTLWRYYGDGRTYYNTRILGRDGQKRLSWKFHSYKSQGTYPETAEGHTFYITRQEVVHIPYINSIVLDPENITNTLIGTNIIIDAEPMVFMPEVIDSVESYRIDAILAANQGRLLKQDVGDLTALTTEENSSIVEAINEIWMDFNETSDYSNALNAVLNAPLMV